MTKRIVLLASGRGTLAHSILEAGKLGLIEADMVGLISDRDSKVLDVARSFGVPEHLIKLSGDRNTWNTNMLETTQLLKPDLVVSVGFMRILNQEYIETFRVINTHPSLLPKYPGAHAVRDTLAAGEIESGATVHIVDAGLDTGPVLTQVAVSVEPDDSEQTLHERIKVAERTMIVDLLIKFGRTGTL